MIQQRYYQESNPYRPTIYESRLERACVDPVKARSVSQLAAAIRRRREMEAEQRREAWIESRRRKH